MARPRKVSDEDVYAAALRVMSRVGPGQLTLGDIAREAGVTAGALVQRFGSKRELLVTLAGSMGTGMTEFFSQLRAQHDAPLDVVRAYATCMAEMAKTPGALLRNFAYLQVDLADPELRKQLVAQSRSVHKELAALLREAIRRGELDPESDVPALVRNLEALVSGALLTWAFHQKGTAARWIGAHVDALLAPYVVGARGRGERRGRMES